MTTNDVLHQPVLLRESIDLLAVVPGGRYVDGTAGGGGHSAALLEASSPGGIVLSLDVDPVAVERVRGRLEPYGSRSIVTRANFEQLDARASEYGLAPVNGVLLDLGISSYQLADPRIGLSFQRDDPLDMRLDPGLATTAADLVNQSNEEDLANLIFRYGEEPASRRIARAIVQQRPIETAARLAAIVARAVGRPRDRIHPATRVFQALRIAVNDELGALERGLAAAIRVVRPGGRIAVISFHSLEDRIVKQTFALEARDCICPPALVVCQCGHKASLRLVTRHPVTPSEHEIRENPRARSAKLRVAERIGAAA